MVYQTKSQKIIDIEVNPELQEAYSLVDKYILDLWQQKRNTCATGSFYRQLVPKVSNIIKYTNAARKEDVVITRLQQEKYKLNSYLCAINRHKDGLCSICNVPETIRHYLLECPNSPISNAIKSVCTELSIQPTLEIILNNSTVIDTIYSNNTYREI